MAFYGDDGSALGQQLQQLAQLITQKKQFRTVDQRERDQTVLNTWAGNPGQAIENVPGAVDAYRRIFGKAPTPGQVATPETLAQTTARGIRGNPVLLDIATTNAATGQPGTKSSRAVATEAGTSEVNADTGRTVADTTKKVVDQAATTIAAAPPETQSVIGQSMLLPGSITIAELNARDQTGKLRQNMLAAAHAALNDPHGAGAGLDRTIRTVTGGRAGLTDAAAAIAMGTDDFLKIMGQMVVNNAAGRGVAENIQKGVAEDISKNSRGYWSPDEIVSYWNYQNSGHPDPNYEQSPKYQGFVRAQQLGGQAYLNTLAQENSPTGQMIQAFTRFAGNRNVDDQQMGLFISGIRNTIADQMTGARLGPRERYEPINGGSNELLKMWDDAQAAAMRLVPLPNPTVSLREWLTGDTAPILQTERGGYTDMPSMSDPSNAALGGFLDSLKIFRGEAKTPPATTGPTR